MQCACASCRNMINILFTPYKVKIWVLNPFFPIHMSEQMSEQGCGRTCDRTNERNEEVNER